MTSRAVVIGAGISGLLAAAAVSKHVDEVDVLEQDTGTGPRRGVAQSRQLHNLLGRAQQHLEELFPGFRDAVVAAGASVARVAEDTEILEYGVRMPRRDVGLFLLGASQRQVEGVLRGLLPATVRVQQGTRVTGLCGDDRITGVRIGTERLPADVVVDATGASSRADRWLATIAAPVPRCQESVVDRWYVSMPVHRPAEAIGNPTFWLFFPTPPATAGCLVSPVDASSWLVSASGGIEDPIPRDLDGIRRHVERLGDDAVLGILARATPAGTPTLFRRPVVRWRRYDLIEGPVEGFLALGDAVAALNPLLGQGISVAAWQASLLAACMPGAAEFHRQTARPICAAVALADLERQQFDDTVRQMTARTYLPALACAARKDVDLHRDYVRMWHLLTPVEMLTSRKAVARVMGRGHASTGAVVGMEVGHP